MISILAGLGTALCWAAALLTSTAAARRIGARSTLAGGMLVGLAIAVPAVLVSERPVLGTEEVAFLAVSGLGNVFGLLMSYTAARLGKVSIVGPIVSTEGAIAAAIAVIFGEQVAPGAGLVLALLVVGVVLAAREPDPDSGPSDASTARIVAFAIGAALAFGVSIYATGRVAEALPIAWTILPARLAGVLIVAVPLLLRGGLGVTRSALPFVVGTGVAEVAGILSFAVGAREGIAVTSVVASQFPAFAAIGAFLFFKERLARVQLTGVVLIAVGVAVLAALRA